MVSTRGYKVKFAEGEKVLCYEPDPTKAKVLYESKVLEVIQNKEIKGKKTEYLIHFQGWNASWDRCVTEDLVLKDSEESRALQKQLAEEAQLRMKEKRRKRRLSEALTDSMDSDKPNKSRRDSECSMQALNNNEELAPGSSCADATGIIELDGDDGSNDEFVEEQQVLMNIPDALKAVLERDYYLINDKNKLVNLPTAENVLSILENYVRFFAMRYLPRLREKRKIETNEREKSHLTLDLCKEVMDGIRVCFDFHIHTHLLYNKEKAQAERLKIAVPLKVEKDKDAAVDIGHVDSKETHMRNNKDDVKEALPKRQLRSSRPVDPPPPKELPMPVSPPPVEGREKPLQGTSKAPGSESGRSTPTTVTSLGSDVGRPFDSGGSLSYPFSHIHLILSNWTLLPEVHRHPPPPAMLYGGVHLLRLFVKLPEILFRMNLHSEKKKNVVKHVALFLELAEATRGSDNVTPCCGIVLSFLIL